MTKKIGFTTTIPVETILSAGHIPVDLNNIFITSENPLEHIERAENDGIPRSTCAWIKGIYSTVLTADIDEVITVTEGDCSNNHALAELFGALNIPVHNFSYPYGKSPDEKLSFLENEISILAKSLGTTYEKSAAYCKHTDPIREKLRKLDELTISGKVSGFENHLYLVSSTDFNGDLFKFECDIDKIIKSAESSPPVNDKIRIGVLGVPTIFTDMYSFLEEQNAVCVFNEIQRQFAIPSKAYNFAQRYVDYTYPYNIYIRLEDIKNNIAERKIDGIIHYVQSFCYRQIQDITIRRELDIPILTIEGDSPSGLDARSKIRIESFIEMLEAKKNAD